MTEPQPPDQPESGPAPTTRDVQYKGAPLDSEKGPGLGCFWSQVVLLVVLLVLTPLSVAWEWPTWASAALLILVLVLLLFAGQTVIFLLRLVAADRRAAGRRRPLASATPTVGEIEERGAAPNPAAPDADVADGGTAGAGSGLAAGTGTADGAGMDPAAPDERPGDGGDGVRE